MRRSNALWLLLTLAACGGGAAPADPAATAAVVDSLHPDSTAGNDSAKKFTHKVKVAMIDTGAVASPQSLVRETYGYSFTSASRDPFRALVVATTEGPELPDLTLVGLIYNRTDPRNSLATFLDIQNKKRYNVRPGDHIGRLQFVTVDDKSATLRVNEFGTTQEKVYPLRKEDGNL